MNILQNFKKWFYGTPGTGALLDTRGKEEKRKDWRFEEAVAKAAPVVWKEKPEAEWRQFPELDQYRTFTCVAQTIKKLMMILYWLKTGNHLRLSASHIYQRRRNKPTPGMMGVDALDIAKSGVTLEDLTPDSSFTDEQIDATLIEQYKQDVGKVFRIGNYLVMPTGNIDTIASTIQQTGKGVMIWFYFEQDEWGRKVPFTINPNLNLLASDTLRHSVTAVDFTLYNGLKSLVVEDSAHFGGLSRRVITEAFFKSRNYFAAYPVSFVFESQIDPKLAPPLPVPQPDPITKPTHMFTKSLQFSDSVNYIDDVKALQTILQYEGLFPANITPTGYYGSITAKAILAFQKKYQVATDDELDQLQGRYVGPKTLAKLNELYSS